MKTQWISGFCRDISQAPLFVEFLTRGSDAYFNQIYAELRDSSRPRYSHSIVPGGLLVTSYTTRFTPFTSLMMRVAVSPRNFMSNW